MADVRDVLGITPSSSGGGATPNNASRSSGPPGSTPSSTSRSQPANAVPRELQQLLNWNGASTGLGLGMGESIPLATVPPLGGFKAKRVRAVAWKLLPIRSSARCALTGKPTDDLDLMHWVKIHNVPDYRFAKFAKQIKMLEYTDEEYENYLHDPQWTRPETDRLMELGKKYDLRFIIMQDRYLAMSEEAAARHRSEALAPVDPERLKAATRLLHAKPHAGESKEEIEAHAKTTENTVTLSANTTMSVPSNVSTEATQTAAVSAAMTGAPMVDLTTPPAVNASATTSANVTVPPVIGDGVIVPSAAVVAAANGNAPPPATFPSIYQPSAASAGANRLDPSIPGVFPERTVEQLKARFYFIQQTLASLRNATDPDLRKSNPLFTHPYDAAHELLRKTQLERLYQRKASDVDEMAEIVLEHRNITNQIKKIKKAEKESRDALRGYKTGGTKASSRSGATAVGAAGVGVGVGVSANKKKGVPGLVGVPSVGGGMPKRAPGPIVLGELAPLPASCDASLVLPSRPNGSVYLRSTQLADPLNTNPRQAKHLESELTQLNIKRAKDLPVPTGVVCELWDKLRVNILTLVNLQQYVRDKETMRDDLRLHAANTAPTSTTAVAAAAASSQPPVAPVVMPPPPMYRQPTMDNNMQQTAVNMANQQVPFSPMAGGNPAAAANAAMQQQQQQLQQQQAAAAAAARKKQEKRRLDGNESEQEDKRPRVKK